MSYTSVTQICILQDLQTASHWEKIAKVWRVCGSNCGWQKMIIIIITRALRQKSLYILLRINSRGISCALLFATRHISPTGEFIERWIILSCFSFCSNNLYFFFVLFFFLFFTKKHYLAQLIVYILNILHTRTIDINNDCHSSTAELLSRFELICGKLF